MAQNASEVQFFVDIKIPEPDVGSSLDFECIHTGFSVTNL